MTVATFLQIIRIIFMVGGASITAKTGLTLEGVESVVGPTATAVGAAWSLYEGTKARKAAQ